MPLTLKNQPKQKTRHMDIVLQDTGARRSDSLTMLNAHGDFCAAQEEAIGDAPRVIGAREVN